MRSLTCVSVVVCVARKLRPCPSYSRRRDRINLGLWRSLHKGGGYKDPPNGRLYKEHGTGNLLYSIAPHSLWRPPRTTSYTHMTVPLLRVQCSALYSAFHLVRP